MADKLLVGLLAIHHSVCKVLIDDFNLHPTSCKVQAAFCKPQLLTAVIFLAPQFGRLWRWHILIVFLFVNQHISSPFWGALVVIDINISLMRVTFFFLHFSFLIFGFVWALLFFLLDLRLLDFVSSILLVLFNFDKIPVFILLRFLLYWFLVANIFIFIDNKTHRLGFVLRLFTEASLPDLVVRFLHN